MSTLFREEYRVLSDKEEAAIQTIKERASALADTLIIEGQGREQSLAITKLEECVMWAVKGITK